VSDKKTPAVAAVAPIAAKAQKSPAPVVTELKVSANLMTLDSGLFCIFNAPGSPLPDPATGLPGVRISAPPGPVFRPDAVTITGFRDDGWLGGWNGAALVRVTRGPAQVLVTIYQAPNSTGDAPRLQVLRLAESAALPPLAVPQQAAGAQPQALPRPPAANQGAANQGAPRQVAAAQPVAGPVANDAPRDTPAGTAQSAADAAKAAEIVAHVQGRGDVLCRLGEWMGAPDSKQWIEGFAVAPKGAVGPGDIEYQAVLGRGWLSPWAEGGQFCGSRGMSLPILGLRMRLRGEAAERFDCVVSASFVDGTKVGPLDNGEPCQAESMSPLEAFNITLVPRTDAAEAPAAPAAPAKTGKPAKPEPAKVEPAKVESARTEAAKPKAAAPKATAPAKPAGKPRAPGTPPPKPPKPPVRGRK
jgi:hypothetical protein